MIDIEAAFGVKVVESHVADEIDETEDSDLLTARESARLVLETYDEEPETVAETTDGFAVSGDRHAILFHPAGVQVHDPDSVNFDPDDEDDLDEATFKKGQKIAYTSQNGKKLTGKVVSDVGGKYKVKVMPDKPNTEGPGGKMTREAILVPREAIELREDDDDGETEQVLDVGALDEFLARLAIKGRLPRAEVRAYENAKLIRDEAAIIETATALAAVMEEQNAFDEYMAKKGYKNCPMPKTPSRGKPGGKIGSAYMREDDEDLDEAIDKGDVKDAAWKAAQKVHGKDADEKIVNEIVKKAIKRAESTEDAIQIAVNMVRGKSENIEPEDDLMKPEQRDALQEALDLLDEDDLDIDAVRERIEGVLAEAAPFDPVAFAQYAEGEKFLKAWIAEEGDDRKREIFQQEVAGDADAMRRYSEAYQSVKKSGKLGNNGVQEDDEDEDDLDVLETDDDVWAASILYDALDDGDITEDDLDDEDALIAIVEKRATASEKRKRRKDDLRRSRGRFKVSRSARLKLSRSAKKLAKSAKGKAARKKAARKRKMYNSVEFPKSKMNAFLQEANNLGLGDDVPIKVDGDKVVVDVPEEHTQAVEAAVA